MKANAWRFWVLVIVLVAGGVFINAWERAGEAHVERQELVEFPAILGTWEQRGADERFDAETEKILRASDYLSRVYKSADNRLASLYVGYHATQRTGATYHSPLNCLPGAGWTMTDPATVIIKPVDGGSAFEANRYIIRKGNEKQLLLYWYQGRGRIIASEYWGKIYTVIDSARLRRSDGAMVRVMTPIGASEQDAVKAATDLAAQAAPLLDAHVPN